MVSGRVFCCQQWFFCLLYFFLFFLLLLLLFSHACRSCLLLLRNTSCVVAFFRFFCSTNIVLQIYMVKKKCLVLLIHYLVSSHAVIISSCCLCVYPVVAPAWQASVNRWASEFPLAQILRVLQLAQCRYLSYLFYPGVGGFEYVLLCLNHDRLLPSMSRILKLQYHPRVEHCEETVAYVWLVVIGNLHSPSGWLWRLALMTGPAEFTRQHAWMVKGGDSKTLDSNSSLPAWLRGFGTRMRTRHDILALFMLWKRALVLLVGKITVIAVAETKTTKKQTEKMYKISKNLSKSERQKNGRYR